MLSPLPYDPLEPDAIIVAQALGALYGMNENDPLFEEVYEYWQNAIKNARKSNHALATTADEYEKLESPSQTTTVFKNRSYADIKEEVSILDYAERFGEFKHSGGKYKAKCFIPGHEDKTASLWIYPQTKSFYCFGCHRGGDTIDLIKLMGDNPYDYPV